MTFWILFMRNLCDIMKYKKVMLVTLTLLAILTIGAVSATDVLAADETPDSLESSVDDEIIIAEDNSSGDSENNNDNLGISPDNKYSEEELIDSNMSIEFDRNDYKLKDYADIYVKLPDDATGELTFYINGEEEEWTNVDGGTEYFSGRLGEFGTTNFTAEYSGDDKYLPAIKTISYVLDNTQYSINIEENIIYGQKEVEVWFPNGFSGDISVRYNGKTYKVLPNIIDEDCIDGYYFDGSDLKYGENNVTLSYEGDETFGKYFETKTVNVQSKIQYDNDITYGDKFTASIVLPSDATGTFKLYASQWDDDKEDYVETVIKSTNVQNGAAKITLNNLTVGRHSFEAKYEGNYGEVHEDCWIRVDPIITYPDIILEGSDKYITITCSNDITGTVYITDTTYDEHDNKDENEFSTKFENGVAKIPLNNLKTDYHYIEVSFDLSEDDSFYDSFGIRVINTTKIDFDVNLYFDDVLINSEYNSFRVDINPEYATGNVTILIDGKVYEIINIYDDEEMGYSDLTIDSHINVTGLDYGTHNLEIKYTSDFFDNETFKTSFEIVPAIIRIPEEMRFNLPHVWSEMEQHIDYITVEVQKDATGTISVLVDGEVFEVIQIDPLQHEYTKSYASDLYNLTLKEYDVSVTYSGDDKYPKITKDKLVNLTYDVEIYLRDSKLTIRLPEEIKNGDLEILIDGEKYSWNTTSYLSYSFGCHIECDISDLKLGNHSVVVTYSGDEKFYPQTFSEIISIGEYPEYEYKYIEYDYGDMYFGDEKEVYLILPDDAKGKLLVKIYSISEDYDKTLYSSENVSFVNNKASYVISNLPVGHYEMKAYYTGDDYSVYDRSYDFDVKAFEFNYPYRISDNLTVSARLDEKSSGNLVVTVYETTDGDNVEIDSKTIELKDGKATYTFPILKFGEYKVVAKYEENGKKIFSETTYITTYDDLDVYIPYETIYGDSLEISADLPKDATGNITIYIEKDNDNYEIENPVIFNKTYPVSGPFTTQLPKLELGRYEAFATYIGNYGKGEVSYGEDFRIIPKVEIPEILSPYKENAVNFELSNRNGNLAVIFDNELISNSTLTNGKARIVLPDVSKPKNYLLKLQYYENGTIIYEDSDYCELKYPANIAVDANEPAAGEDLVLDITIPKFFKANLTAVVEDKTYCATIENGIANVIIPNLAAGEYDITINYNSENRRYGDEVKVIKATVSQTAKETPVIEIKSDERIVEGSDLNVEVTIQGATGTVSINGKKVNLTNSKASATISNVKAGDLIITAQYSGDDKFIKASAEKTVVVYAKANPELTVKVSDVNVGDDATVNIEINKDATGKVTVDGNEVTITNGKGTYTISNLASGNYTKTVKFDGDSKFESSQKTVRFTVSKLPAPEIEINVPESIVEKNDLEVEVAIPGATGTITVNGEEIALTDGKAKTTIKNVEAGNLTINVDYNGDDRYLATSGSKTVEVTKKVLKDAGLKVSANNAQEGKDITVSIEISKDITGKVTIDANEVTITNGKGTYTISNLASGNYTKTVIFEGDDDFKADEKTVSFSVTTAPSPADDNSSEENATPVKVDPKIVAKDMTVQYYAGKYYQVTVYGDDGKVASGVSVTFTLNGKKVTTTKTNENGIAKFKVTQTPITKAKIITNALGVSVTKKLTISRVLVLKAVTVKKSAKKLVLTATLKKVNGKYLKGKKITFKFNGKKYTAKTDKKGIAKVTIKSNILKKLKVGKKITYQATYVKDTVKKTVKIKK